jgi:hypothetical protein
MLSVGLDCAFPCLRHHLVDAFILESSLRRISRFFAGKGLESSYRQTALVLLEQRLALVRGGVSSEILYAPGFSRLLCNKQWRHSLSEYHFRKHVSYFLHAVSYADKIL